VVPIVCAFQTKSFVIWEPSVLKSRFLFNIIRDTQPEKLLLLLGGAYCWRLLGRVQYFSPKLCELAPRKNTCLPGLLFENQVCWKADFCFKTSIITQTIHLFARILSKMIKKGVFTLFSGSIVFYLFRIFTAFLNLNCNLLLPFFKSWLQSPFFGTCYCPFSQKGWPYFRLGVHIPLRLYNCTVFFYL